jgi:hypothetical protein
MNNIIAMDAEKKFSRPSEKSAGNQWETSGKEARNKREMSAKKARRQRQMSEK